MSGRPSAHCSSAKPHASAIDTATVLARKPLVPIAGRHHARRCGDANLVGTSLLGAVLVAGACIFSVGSFYPRVMRVSGQKLGTPRFRAQRRVDDAPVSLR